MRTIFILCLVILTSCSDDGTTQSNDLDPIRKGRDASRPDKDLGDADFGADQRLDLREDMGTQSDSGQADAGPKMCNPPLNRTFDLQPDPKIGQLYARSVFAGNSTWIVNAGPAKEGQPEAIFLARLDCEGRLIHPVQISPAGSDHRHLQPVIVAKEGVVFVSWYSQNPDGKTFLWLRSYNDDGSEITNAPVDITPQENGQSLSNLIWEPAIAARSGNDAAVVFSYATVKAFKVGFQKIDRNGRVGSYFVPVQDPENQKKPSLGVDGAGDYIVSWIRETATTKTSFLTKIVEGATQGTPASGVPSKPLASQNPLARVSKHASGSGTSFQAFQVSNNERSDILVRSASNFSSVNSVAFGLQQNNIRPSIATGDTGGALAWFRYTNSPSHGKIVLQAFAEDLQAGQEKTFNMDAQALPPYGPDITHVEDNIYFITWSEGENGRGAQVKGRFVELRVD